MSDLPSSELSNGYFTELFVKIKAVCCLKQLKTLLLLFACVFWVLQLARVSRHDCTKRKWRREEPYRLMMVAPSTTTNKMKPTVDIIYDYYPYIDFKMVYPHIRPVFTEQHDIFLLVVVNSGAKGKEYRERREVIRQTWGSHNTCEQRKMGNKKLEWFLVFVVGVANENDDKLNKQEAAKYNDMLIGNIRDNYNNNIMKYYMSQLFVASMITAKYTLKLDDDVYVRIPRVLEYIENEGFPRRFYGGVVYNNAKPRRNLSSKWSISWRYVPEEHFPPYCMGALILMSTDLLSPLFNFVHVRKPFHLDDAYIGLALHKAKIIPKKIISFVIMFTNPLRYIKNMSDCEIFQYTGISHYINTKLIRSLHDRYEQLCDEDFANVTCKYIEMKQQKP